MGQLDMPDLPCEHRGQPAEAQIRISEWVLVSNQRCTTPAAAASESRIGSADSFDARTKISQETLWQCLVTIRAFDGVTGWLKSFKRAPATPAQHKVFPTMGPRRQSEKRKDLNQSSLTEEFFYDNLYRLDHSTLNGTSNLLIVV
jgi:hypothetical protein